MKYIGFGFFLLLLSGLKAQDISDKSLHQVLLERTNMIRFGGASATCFALSDSNNIYLITVKHLFAKTVIRKSRPNANGKYLQVDSPLCENAQEINVEVLYHKKWTPFKGTIHFFTQSNTNIDVCIIKLREKSPLSTIHYLEPGAFLGQACFFAGYPLGLRSPTDSNIDFDLPIVKYAIYSGSYTNTRTGEEVILLDGNNTYGLSGAPVFSYNYTVKNWRMIGMVCGYFKQTDSVFNSNTGHYEAREENSGIVKGIRADQIMELLNQIRK